MDSEVLACLISLDTPFLKADQLSPCSLSTSIGKTFDGDAVLNSSLTREYIYNEYSFVDEIGLWF